MNTDFNGEPVVVLSAEEARWLAEFIQRHWDVDEDCVELRRVAGKVRRVDS